MYHFQHLGQDLYLLREKAIYWKNQNALLIADPHLGKITHFRKAGIPIPKEASHKNLEILQQLIQTHRPEKLIFLGDLFHSELNTEWLNFKEFMREHNSIEFILIKGNHDILEGITYGNTALTVVDSLDLEPYNFTHEPNVHAHLYNLSGHLHPGVRLHGKGRQSMRLPCFHFGANQGLLPAFGQFTGLHIISPKSGDSVFIITQQNVQQVL